MARQKTQTIINTEDAPAPGLPSLAQSLQQSDALEAQIDYNARAVAKQLGYEGAMTVGALEDEIRFYQRRTAEACLELGKRLLILKELTPQGEFIQRCELLGFHKRMAQRFMQAAFKFSKSDNLSLLTERIGSQSKLLELVTMDDEDIEQLANGETVRGLTLDEIDTLTASQLKAKLRETEANYQAQSKVLADKSALADKLATKLTAKEQLIQHKSPDEIAQQLRQEALTNAFEAEHAIQNKLGATFKALIEHSLDNGGDHQKFMLGLIVQIEHEILKVREEFGLHGSDITPDDTPDWMKSDQEALAEQVRQDMAIKQAELDAAAAQGKAH